MDAVAAAGRDAASGDAAAAVREAFEALEEANECVAPVESPMLKGEWELLWTTSDSILGLGRPWIFRPDPQKPILQYLDPAGKYARNLEYTPLGKNKVEATIGPLDAARRAEFVSRLDDFLMFKVGSQEKAGGTYVPGGANLEKTTVGVQFRFFTILDWFRLPAPENAKGILQVTYLDEDLRLSRGDRGNLFVLRKVGEEKVE